MKLCILHHLDCDGLEDDTASAVVPMQTLPHARIAEAPLDNTMLRVLLISRDLPRTPSHTPTSLLILLCAGVLQIKLFDQPLPPLQVTALSSAVAWLATTCIIKATGDV